jgi:hypothetical protein
MSHVKGSLERLCIVADRAGVTVAVSMLSSWLTRTCTTRGRYATMLCPMDVTTYRTVQAFRCFTALHQAKFRQQTLIVLACSADCGGSMPERERSSGE